MAVPSPTLPPATTTNCWLLGHAAVVAVDPAGVAPQDQAGLVAALDGRSVQAIFLTHHHGDHVGGARDLQSRTGAPILAHPHTAAKVQFPVDRLIDEGDVLQTDAGCWTALLTPGHARGHLCLRSEDGDTIVAGDMLAGEGTIVLDPPEGDLAAYLSSLARLAALEPSRLLPSHGAVIEPALPMLEHYVAHRHARTRQIRLALEACGSARPRELVAAVYPDLPLAFHPVAGRQVLCHLLWLADQGAVGSSGDTFFSHGGAA